MDTRFWGPSAWKLLHLVAESCDSCTTDLIKRHDISVFLQTIPYILPCKFCRSSLTDYYRQYPFLCKKDEKDDILPRLKYDIDLSKWMYNIHNCVNDKLRKQGLHPSPNPPYSKVKQYYKIITSQSWEQNLRYLWDFLFSVAYHHPTQKKLYETPLPGCPKDIHHCQKSDERNKWNTLPLLDRLKWFYRFWRVLPDVMPSEMGRQWKRAEKRVIQKWNLTGLSKILRKRESALDWLWKMRCELEQGYHDPYSSVCKRIANYSSDCAHAKGVFTCRKTQKAKKNATTSHRVMKKTKKHTRS